MSFTRPQVDRADTPLDQAGRFREVRCLTETLAEPLSAEDQTVQSMDDVSPTKWHRAHTTWFFETFILEAQVSGYRPYHPAFRFLFNSYYEAVGPRHSRPERGLLSRPGVEEISAYRRAVDAAVLELLDAGVDDGAASLLELGLHHEQQHQELLLMDIKHVLSVNPLDPAYRPWASRAQGPLGAPLTWLAHEGGLVEIGHAGDGFAFDNELPNHPIHLAPFELASRPVTSGEWLEFMDDGGYGRADLWLSDGWAAVQSNGWTAPLYWRDDGAAWSAFTLAGRRPVEPAEPVCHVSYYEADAYARWAGARLPSEGEWEHAVRGTGHVHERFQLDALHPKPTAGGLDASTGEVWEWTSSAYLPYPGYSPAPGAVGEYNGKFMVNQHVLRGRACVTPSGHARLTYRNFFPPASRWPFAGVRLARDL